MAKRARPSRPAAERPTSVRTSHPRISSAGRPPHTPISSPGMRAPAVRGPPPSGDLHAGPRARRPEVGSSPANSQRGPKEGTHISDGMHPSSAPRSHPKCTQCRRPCTAFAHLRPVRAHDPLPRRSSRRKSPSSRHRPCPGLRPTQRRAGLVARAPSCGKVDAESSGITLQGPLIQAQAMPSMPLRKGERGAATVPSTSARQASHMAGHRRHEGRGARRDASGSLCENA
mmetsp:Transcript_170059/g.545451  ORF Transcript_170059/g.545451 Transcript_170059/m.545451 type:complete len:229 (+) Transcript_170059:297-983(+)